MAALIIVGLLMLLWILMGMAFHSIVFAGSDWATCGQFDCLLAWTALFSLTISGLPILVVLYLISQFKAGDTNG